MAIRLLQLGLGISSAVYFIRIHTATSHVIDIIYASIKKSVLYLPPIDLLKECTPYG
jgi:hypothetical protein